MTREIFLARISLMLFLLFPATLRAQQQDTHIPIPMKGGIVFYEKKYETPKGIDEERGVRLAQAWIKKIFPDNTVGVQTTADARTVSGIGIFKVPVSKSGNFFWIRMKVMVLFRDGGYTFQLYDYYEKPIEKGISNEYSKIEYRWRDFSQGKPWSPEDNRLFEGIQQQSIGFMDSFEAELK